MSVKDSEQLQSIIENLKANHMATFKEPISDREIESLLRHYYTQKREAWLSSRLGDLTIPEYQDLIDSIRQPQLREINQESPLRQKALEAIDPNEMAKSLQSAVKTALEKGQLQESQTIPTSSTKKRK